MTEIPQSSNLTNSENAVGVNCKVVKGAFTLEVDITLAGRGVTAIFGASGSGKTTLLRCIAGLDKPGTGVIHFNGQPWQNPETFIAPHARPVGYVFQNPGLFPHLCVAGNLRYATKRAAGTRITDTDYSKVIDVLKLAPLLERKAWELSGGEAQRVAIARALLVKPKLLLMDEPLSALDATAKQEVMAFLEHIKYQYSLPIFYVSHSINEVMRLADDMVVLDKGKVQTQGSVVEVFSNLNLPFQTGDESGVILHGAVESIDQTWQLALVSIGNSNLWVNSDRCWVGQSIRLRVLARDVSITLKAENETSILNKLPAVIKGITAANTRFNSLLQLDIDGSTIFGRVTNKSISQLSLVEGKRVWAQVKTVAVMH